MQTRDRQGVSALEVIVSFDGAVLGVHHLLPGEALRLGPPEAQPDYPLDGLPQALAVAESGPVPRLSFPDDAEGAVTLADGAARTLPQLRAAGLCEPVAGGLRYALPAGATAELRIGTLAIRVAEVALEQRTVPAAPPLDWRAQRFTLAPLFVYGAALGLALLLPPDPRALAAGDLSRLDNATLRTRYVPAVVELKLVERSGPEQGGAAPKPAPGAAGRVGSPRARDRAVTTVREARPPQRSGDDLLAAVKTSGVLAVMGASMARGPLAQLVDRDSSALGQDAKAVLSGLVATTDHIGWGPGGMSLVPTGSGPGGGCVGADCGTTVAASLRGICDGGRCDALSDGRTRRLLRLPTHGHRPGTPEPTLGHIETVGGLDKEIVRRVLRARMNEFKYCYERELVRSPELAGRVVMSFVIGRDGRVMSAGARESTLGSAAVHSCLAQAVQRLSFPRPEGGIVQVSYPFLFHAAEQR